MTFSSCFEATLLVLHDMLAWVRMHVQQRGCSDAEVRQIELVLEEVFVNIIEYAYERGKGKIEITYQRFAHNWIGFVIKDDGKPFNPLENRRAIDRSSSLESRKAGGLGIALVHAFMDGVEYVRDAERNVLTLKKKCGGTNGAE